MNKPDIRFNGFNGEWTEKKFEDLVDVQSGRDYKHLSEGTIPVYGTGGYMLSVDEALSYNEDAVGIGRKGTIDKPYILKAPFWTVDTLFYSIPKNKMNLDFIFSAFQTIRWKDKDESTGVPSLSKNAINSTEIKIPNESAEQKKLGALFSQMDSLIASTQKEYDKLVALKKCMLQKMFPKKGRLVPEIRFEGFSGDWVEKKLGKIFRSISNAFVGTASPYYVENGHFYLESNNVKNGQINRNSEIFINDEFYYNQRHKWLHENDIVMVQSGHVGHSAVIPKELDNTAAHALIIFTDKYKTTDSYFINYSFMTSISVRQIEGITKGNTIKHILSSDMKNFIISIPNDYEEQQKIGSYFQNLDNLISKQSSELEKLKNVKKTLLSKMFV